MYLVAVPRIKQFLEIANNDQDPLLSLLTQYYSARIQTYLRRKLEKAERVIVFNGGKKIYALPAYPVDTVTKPVVKIADVLQEEDNNYYVWYDRGVIEFPYPPNINEPKILEVTWTGGYALIDDSSVDDGSLAVPEDIRLACMMQVAFVFKRKRDLGITSITMPDGSISTQYAGALLPEVIDILKSYRNMVGFNA